MDIEIGKYQDDLTIAYRPDIGIMYEVSDEKTVLTSESVFSISAPATEGTLKDLTTDAVTASSGDAEAMPLISGRAVKAVVTTKPGQITQLRLLLRLLLLLVSRRLVPPVV